MGFRIIAGGVYDTDTRQTFPTLEAYNRALGAREGLAGYEVQRTRGDTRRVGYGSVSRTDDFIFRANPNRNYRTNPMYPGEFRDLVNATYGGAVPRWNLADWQVVQQPEFQSAQRAVGQE